MARPVVPLAIPPLQQITVNGVMSSEWSGWFNQVYQFLKGPFVSSQTGDQNLAPNIQFYPDEVTLVTYVLPTAANIGDIITIVGKGAGGWEITQNPGQSIRSPLGSTTPGSGTLASTNQDDSVVLICTTKDTTFNVLGTNGVLLFT